MITRERLEKHVARLEYDKPLLAQWTEHDEFLLELARALLALQWRPITAEDLPRVGDEVFTKYGDAHTISPEAEDGIWENCADGTWTHFRPINAPERTGQGGSNG